MESFDEKRLLSYSLRDLKGYLELENSELINAFIRKKILT